MHELTVDQFISYCWEVVAWNKVSRGEHDFSDSTTLKQLDYCLEEIQETVKGYEDVNLTEILDGLADSMVTLSYLVFLIRDGKQGCFDHLNHPDNKTYHSGYHTIMLENYRCLYQVPCERDVESTLEDVLAALNDLSDKANITSVVEEVLESNWSKFPYLDQVIPMEECKWIEENRDKEGVSHSVIGNKVVFRDRGGKIMKPSTFKEPNISQHIYNEGSSVDANVSQEVKIGTIVQAKSRETGLTEGELYIVESVWEVGSLVEDEVVYNIRRLNSQSIFGMLESWTDNGWMLVIQGDQDDYDKVDISDQVASIREKILLKEWGLL